MKEAAQENNLKKEINSIPLIKILKGEMPVIENTTKFYVVFFGLLLFWGFAVWHVGFIALSIPGISNLKTLFSK